MMNIESIRCQSRLTGRHAPWRLWFRLHDLQKTRWRRLWRPPERIDSVSLSLLDPYIVSHSLKNHLCPLSCRWRLWTILMAVETVCTVCTHVHFDGSSCSTCMLGRLRHILCLSIW